MRCSFQDCINLTGLFWLRGEWHCAALNSSSVLGRGTCRLCRLGLGSRHSIQTSRISRWPATNHWSGESESRPTLSQAVELNPNTAVPQGSFGGMSMTPPQNFPPHEAATAHGLLSARLRGKSSHECKLSLGFKGLPALISLPSRLGAYGAAARGSIFPFFFLFLRAGAPCFVSPVGAERAGMF